MQTILIVDDEHRIREIYKKIIGATCKTLFRVIEAADADEATEHLVREKIDLILLDIRMPRINGQDMYEIIQECNPQIKVVVASVYPVEEQKKMIPFADAYYDKSCGPVVLLEKVTNTFLQGVNGEEKEAE